MAFSSENFELKLENLEKFDSLTGSSVRKKIHKNRRASAKFRMRLRSSGAFRLQPTSASQLAVQTNELKGGRKFGL